MKLDFAEFFQKASWALMSSVALFVAHEIQAHSKDLGRIESSIAVIDEKLNRAKEDRSYLERRQDQMDDRLRVCESRSNRRHAKAAPIKNEIYTLVALGLVKDDELETVSN